MRFGPSAFRPRLGGLAAWIAVLTAAGAAAAESCPYPLGDHLLTNDVLSYGGSPFDPASQLTDTVWIGTQLGPAQFAYDGGRLQMAFEGETDFEIPNTTLKSEAHIIPYKEFSPRTGWNVRPDFVSSPDTTKPVPTGDHTSPALLALGGKTWVVWEAAGPSYGDPAWPSTGSYLLMRERAGGFWGPIQSFSPTDIVSRAGLPQLAAVGGTPLAVFQTNRLNPDSSEFHIAAATFGAGGLGAPVNVSTADDGWSDEGVSLASDGTRAAAAWTARNVSDIFAFDGSEVRVSVRSAAGVWTAPALASVAGQDGINKPAVVWHDGLVWVAWTARDFNVSAAGDLSLFLRTLNPDDGALGPAIEVTGASLKGDERSPAMVSYNGTLRLIWGSTSAADGSGSTWQVARTFTCTWRETRVCPAEIVDRPSDALFADLWPGFLVIGDMLVATYALNFGDFIGTAANQHTVTRVLERGPWAGDQLSASYGEEAATPNASGVARLSVRFSGPSGAAMSDHFALRMSDGTVVRLPAGFSEREFKVPYRGGLLARPVEALWCGEPIPLTQFALGPAPSSGLLPGFGLAEALAGAVLAAALAVALRRRPEPPSPMQDRQARDEP